MYHIFYIDGLISEDKNPPSSIAGNYLGSAATREKAQEYVYSCECGKKLEALGATGNCTLVVIPESEIYVRVPTRQEKQVYTTEELRKTRKWK